MRLMVTGSRDWTDGNFIFNALNYIHEIHEITLLIHGNAPGADKISGKWAAKQKISCEYIDADWDRYHSAAGPIRNTELLKKFNPELVLAIHDDIINSKGTFDAVNKSLALNIPVIHLDGVQVNQITEKLIFQRRKINTNVSYL